MGYLFTNDLSAGMVLNQLVESPDGTMVLGQGTVLNDSVISRLKKWKVKGVVVAEAAPAEFCLDDIGHTISDIIRTLAKEPLAARPPKLSPPTQKEIEEELQRIFLLTRYHGVIPLDRVLTLINEQIEPLLARPESFAMIHSEAPAGNYLYRHALDVAIIAGFLGRWLGYKDVDVTSLLVAGLMHDIGKSRIKFEILSKPTRLNGEELNIARTHAGKSYELLAGTGIVHDAVLAAVLQHHERLDGSGYPFGLCGEAISPLARIIAVADVYDALISNRYYKKSIPPLAAAEIMLEQMSGHFDADVLNCLVENIRQFSLGGSVMLSNHRPGRIVSFNPLPCMRPLVETGDGTIVDLSQVGDVRILEITIA